MHQIKGTLIPIGGNEKKGHDEDEAHSLEFIEEDILYHVVRQSGGKNARVLVVPAASSIPIELSEIYIKAFNKLGVDNVKILNIKTRKDADKKISLELVKQANCIMFTGGDQRKITSKIKDTQLHELLMDRYLNDESFVLAGTSAGAMAMAEEMISGGSSTEAFFKGTVRMEKGLGLLPRVMIDTHFIQRGRFGRQSEAVAKFPRLIGFGLSEDTGMIIKNGNECTVIGSGMVIVFDGHKLKHNNEEVLEEGTPMTMVNLRVHVLSNSDKFNIKKRKVTVLPIEAPFI
ncbi:MAG: cyanophycinase [Bacteroidia bacterium]|nr:cyanophycinase [Bacteroidia bacterium]NNF81592.1 cyanophycinase [Flavobacteriaceae bacterium]NNK69472.1 cyanophycinase [Flavobacteriaceae bacterium]NNL79098.1 cyanophycinase [Flavobacteriaceae bacterium]